MIIRTWRWRWTRTNRTIRILNYLQQIIRNSTSWSGATNPSFLTSFHSAYHFSRNESKAKGHYDHFSMCFRSWLFDLDFSLLALKMHPNSCYCTRRGPKNILVTENENSVVRNRNNFTTKKKKKKKKILDKTKFLHTYPWWSVSVLFIIYFHSSSLLLTPKHASNWLPVTQPSFPVFVVHGSPCLSLSPRLKFRDHMIFKKKVLL